LRKAAISFVMPVALPSRPSARMVQLCPNWTDFNKIWYLIIFGNCWEYYSFLKIREMMATLHEYQYTFLIVSLSVLLFVPGKICRDNQNTHLVFKFFFRKSYLFLDNAEKNIVQPVRPQMTNQYGTCTLHTGYLGLQTHSHNLYYLLIFHCNNDMHERATILRHTYIACLVSCQSHRHPLKFIHSLWMWRQHILLNM
jgi:hypothetical protein